MYDDLEALNVDVVDVKLKNNFAIAFFDNFLVIDRSKCKTAAQERTVLAHEAGHYMSGAFYRAYSPFEVKEQAEHRAFAASVEKYSKQLSDHPARYDLSEQSARPCR